MGKKYTFYCVLIAAFLAFIIISCNDGVKDFSPITIQLWPTRANSTESTEKPLPSRGDSVLRITDISEPTIIVYRVEGAENPVPAVLIFPGGAYAYLAVNKEGTDVAKWFNSIGVTAVLVKYSVPDKRETAFKDGRRAIRLTRYHAKDWNIDSNRVGVIGFSAGGHLAARLSTDFQNRIYEKVDKADLEKCRPDFSLLLYPAYLENKETNKLADEIIISQDIPPTFIVQTKDDSSLVGGTILYDQALRKAGISSVFHLFPEGGHGYGIWPSKYEVSHWPDLCEEWLKEKGIINNNSEKAKRQSNLSGL